MKKILLLLFLSQQLAYGQKNPYDSLEQRLSIEKNTSGKLEILKQLVDIAFNTDIRKALDYSKQAVQIAQQAGDQNWLPKFFEMQGRMYANLVQLDSADMFFAKAMAGYSEVKNKKGQATTYFKIAWVFKKRGEIDKAMEADLKALRIMEELNDKEGICSAYNRVSDNLTRQNRLTEAMEYAKKSIEFSEKNNLNEELMYALWNAGSVAIAQNNAALSFTYYDRALEFAYKLDAGPLTISDFCNARGNALKRLGHYKEALEDYKKANALARETNYSNAISATIANLGELNMLMGNYKDALAYQLETVRLQEENHDLSNIVENYQHVSTIYEHLGNYKAAVEYQKKAFAIRDSIASVKSDEAISKMLTQYETKKKEDKIASQETQLSQQKKVQRLGIGVVILLAGFLVFGIFSYRNRMKSNRLLAAKNAENELLLKEIHHRVKNNLEVVSSLLALQSAQIDDPNTKDAMLEGQNRVHSIGIVHQKLYQGENLGAIEMKDYFLNLSESILDSFGAEERIKIELAMEKLDIDIDTAVPLGLIVNELLTNTVKYAFPGGRDGKVLIRLEKQNNGILHMEVSDNGIGKSGVIQGTGFGGQLISLLTTQLNGTMKEEIKNGTSISFDFKLSKVA